MNKTNPKVLKRNRRHARIRSRVSGTPQKPRLAVFKSNTAVYAQLINDDAGVTMAAASTRTFLTGTMREKAHEVGKAIAVAASKIGVSAVVFDRGGFIYTGLIKAVADGARESGLTV